MGDYEKQQGSSDSCYSNSSSDEVALAEDASSSISSSSSSLCSHARAGPLYGLSELMAQLPIKRGLSKFYDGKSRSFSCLRSVRSIDDLRKSEDRSKRLKISKSYEDDLDRRPSPVVVIPKKMDMKKKKKKKLGGCSSLRCASYLPT